MCLAGAAAASSSQLPPSNDEDDEMAEKEGETKYANINKEEGEEGRREGYEEAGGGPGTGMAQRPRCCSLGTFLHMIEPMKSRATRRKVFINKWEV